MATIHTTTQDALQSLVGRMLSHADVLAGWANLPPEIAKDIHAATVILDELTQVLDAIERLTSPRSVAHALVGLDAGAMVPRMERR
jgi:hypothetical protein